MFDYYQSIGCLYILYGYVINLHMVNFQIKIGFLYGRCFVIIYSLIFKYMFQFWAEGCLFFLPMMCWYCHSVCLHSLWEISCHVSLTHFAMFGYIILYY